MEKHFLLVTIPAFGHIIPMIELGNKISDADNQVTLLVSGLIIDEINRRDLISSKITVLGIEDGISDFDFSNPVKMYHSFLHDTSAIANPPRVKGLEMLQQLKGPLLTLLENMPTQRGIQPQKFNSTANKIKIPVDAVIADRFLTSIIAGFCQNRKTPCYIFNSNAGFTMVKELDDLFQMSKIASDQSASSADVPAMTEFDKRFVRVLGEDLELANGIILNTFRELIPETVAEQSQHPTLAGIPIWCIGPLLSPETEKDSKQLKLKQQVTSWLDKQPERSVVYVSFGSICSASSEQVPQVFKALTSLGKPFIWSLREKEHSELSEEVRQAIAEQFTSPNSKFLILPWSPQKTILAHSATKVFVTHCGWNSTLESITLGVPMVGWPMFSDQFNNAKWMESKGVGIVIPETRMVNSRIVAAAEIQASIAEVGGWSDAGQSTIYFKNVQALAGLAKSAVTESGGSSLDLLKLMAHATD